MFRKQICTYCSCGVWKTITTESLGYIKKHDCLAKTDSGMCIKPVVTIVLGCMQLAAYYQVKILDTLILVQVTLNSMKLNFQSNLCYKFKPRNI